MAYDSAPSTFAPLSPELILDAFPGAVALLDAHGTIAAVNESWRTLASLSVSPNGLRVGQPFLEAERDLPPEDRDGERRTVEALRKVLEGRLDIFRAEGDRWPISPAPGHWHRLTIRPMKTERVMGAIVAYEDISDRRQAEVALGERRELHQALSETVSDYAFSVRVDADNRLVVDWVTGEFTRVVGFTAAELEARGGWRTIIHPDDLSLVEEHVHRLLSNQPDVAEFRIVTRSRAVRWLRNRAMPAFDHAQGRVTRIHGAARDLTVEKQTEDAFRVAEDRHRHLMDHATDIIYSCDTAGRFTFVNRIAVKLLQYSEEELLGHHFLRLIRADYRSQAGEFYAAQILGDIPSTYFEFPALAKDGTEIWFGQNVQLVRQQGHLVGVQAIARDITRQKAAEQALRESEARFRAMSDASPLGIFVTDPQGRSLYTNRACADIVGLNPEETLGFGWVRALHPDDEQRVLQGWRDAMDRQVPYNDVIRYLRKDGTVAWTLVHASAMRDGDTVLGYVGVIEDITERRRAEEALRASEEKFRGLVEHALEGVYRSTREGTFLTVNPAFARMLGYDSPETLLAVDIGRDLYVDPKARAQLFESLDRHGEVRNVETILRRKDGQTITTLESARLVREASGASYCEGMLIDVTEHRRLESQLRQSQKMEGIGRLAGGVAHDFNNLLTGILGYAEFTAELLPRDHAGRSNLSQIISAAQRASGLTRQLLAFARRQIVEPRVINLNELVLATEKMLQRLLGEDIQLITVLAPVLSGARVDPGQFEQILINLAVNARDAMPTGGKLIIETGSVVIGEDGVRENPGMSTGPHVMLAAIDDGTGMTDEVRAHLFEPFFTTKPAGQGTGLGLATCYGIIRQAGGYIQVQSQVGHGTTVRIYLPSVDEAVVDLLEPAAETPGTMGDETVLIVEDEPLVREVAVETLRERGYKVLSAATSAAALEVSRAYTSKIHLLVTDVVLPVMSGRRLAEALQAERSDMKVLYMSGYAEEAMVQHGVLEEGLAVLAKPFTPSGLSDKVREALNG